MTKKPDGSWDKSKLPSRHVTEGPSRAPHRSYYYAMGLGTREINQPFVGVASCWNEAAPCNTALMRQAHAVSEGVKAAGATPREFCTITVTDGIAMGHEGMRSSLVSREVIADSVELTIRGHSYDALVGVAGCDKSLPGMMMAMLRLNVPSVFLYGGSILPGRWQGKDVTVVDVFEGVGMHSAGRMSLEDLCELECRPTCNARSPSSISGTVILFGIGLTFATGLLFGLFPALHSTRPDLVSTLKNQAGQPSGAKGAARARMLLATSQIALAMLLLASSGFFVKSLLNVSRLDLGFKHRSRCHVRPVARPEWLLGRPHPAVFSAPRSELRAAPGVTAVTMSTVPLLAGPTGQGVSPCKGSRPDQTRTAAPATTESVRLLRRARQPAHRRTRVHRCRHGEFREGCPRQPDVRTEVRPQERRGRQVDGMGSGRELPQQTRHDDRRSRRGCEIQRSEADGPAAILRASPGVRT